MYIADGLFNTPISFCLMFTMHPTKQQFAQGKLVKERKGKVEDTVFISGQITFRILFFVPATN